MGILQDPGWVEVAAGYRLPDVAVESYVEDQESRNYDAAIPHSIVALRYVEGCIGVLYPLHCSGCVAHLSRCPQLG